MKTFVIPSTLGVLSTRSLPRTKKPRPGAEVVKISLPFRHGVVVPSHQSPSRLRAGEVAVRWVNAGGEVEVVNVDHLRPLHSGDGARVMRSAGGPRRYGRIPLPGKAIGLRRKANALGAAGEWTVVRWDDGQFEVVQKNQLTFLPEL
jgi:hypothetical protein